MIQRNKLYVIERIKNNSSQILICKKSITKSYVEVLSNTKINIQDTIITPLNDYYNNNVKSNNVKYLNQTLSIEDIKSIYKQIKQSEIDIEKRCEILDEAIKDFFPKSGIWYSTCFLRPEELNKAYLPCHLKHYLWMAKLLKQEKNIMNYSVSDILKYITKSTLFEEKRKEYEQTIIKWQISYMLGGGEGWILPKGVDEFSLLFSTDVHKIFRDGISLTLNEIGMDNEAIEEGIEKNQELWLDKELLQSFNHEYNPIMIDYKISLIDEKNEEKPVLEDLPSTSELFKTWKQLKLFHYYLEHKESIDKYGKIRKEYQMTSKEYEEIYYRYMELHLKRMNEIEIYNKRKNPKTLK